MSVKIQINSVEALERLIGGDTELEVELRKSVAVELIKRRIDFKAQEMKDTVAAYGNLKIEQAMKEAIAEFDLRLNGPVIVPLGNTFKQTTKLREEVLKACHAAFQAALDAAIPEIVASVVKHYTENGSLAVIRCAQDKINDALKEALRDVPKAG